MREIYSITDYQKILSVKYLTSFSKVFNTNLDKRRYYQLHLVNTEDMEQKDL